MIQISDLSIFFSDVFFVEEVGVRTISDRSVLFFVFLFVC